MEEDTFIGFGLEHEQIGFSEQKGYEWFERHYNVAELSMYEKLTVALIVNGRPSYRDLVWIRELIVDNPLNHKAVFEWAIIN